LVKTLAPSEPQNSWYMDVHPIRIDNNRFWPTPLSWIERFRKTIVLNICNKSLRRYVSVTAPRLGVSGGAASAALAGRVDLGGGVRFPWKS
jgi:hypothetical protein